MPESPTQVVYRKQGPVLVLRSAVLRAVSGPDQGTGCPMALQRVRAGTAPDNALVLTDPLVSRYHLEVRVQDRGYLVLDLGSTNGTYFRGARIREAELSVGSEVRLGSTVLRLEPGEVSTEEVTGEKAFGGLVGLSPPMQRVYGLLVAVAPTDATVLIEGETGTGKELVAQQIHRQSPRRERSFCVLDCGSLPVGLIESELFGHERGAFTGAVSEREGVFEKCRGGTVFLDEIGELPLEFQTRLLRVLDERTVKRIGSNERRRVDVRLVAATNRNLAHEVREGRFRQDLFYRLAVVRIVLPPLRKRREDIPLLARHFLHHTGCVDPQDVLTADVMKVLVSRRWPGNVRELRNVIERAVVLSDGAEGLLEEPSSSSQPARARTSSGASSPPAASPSAVEVAPPSGWLARALPPPVFQLPYKDLKRALVEELECLYIGRLFERYGKNISRIAQEAGVDRHLVRRVLERLGHADPGGE
jgi:transcriptional regulator with GAF, ATPase, and Fis domain